MWHALSDNRRADVNMYTVCVHGQWKKNLCVSLTLIETQGHCVSQWPRPEFGHCDALKLTWRPDLSSPCAKTCDACARARLTNIKSWLTSHGWHHSRRWRLDQAGPSHQDGGAACNLGCRTASWTQTQQWIWKHCMYSDTLQNYN